MLRTRPFRNRIRSAAVVLLLAGALVIGMALVQAQGVSESNTNRRVPPKTTAADNTTTNTGYRIREGTEIVDRLGYFRAAGDRLTFFADKGKSRFVVLENLNLERVARTIADHPERLQWSVDGVITEFRGVNFLLVRRVVLKRRTELDDD